jgi:methylenetetrahydrofolate dehydrogenase (NAD+)
VSRDQLEDIIIAANDDPNIHGIMVYYPVFGGGHDQYIQTCVSPYKDVEGLGHQYRFNMYHNIRFLDPEETLKCIIPCTPLGIVKVTIDTYVFDRL